MTGSGNGGVSHRDGLVRQGQRSRRTASFRWYSHARRRRDWDAYTALIATLIGVLALLVSGYTAYVQRQQLRAQVWPYLAIDTADVPPFIGLHAVNSGVDRRLARAARTGRDTLWPMTQPTWNEHYLAGELPWDTGKPEPLLVEFVRAGRIAPGPTLEIGAGTGTNARWLAEQGFDVLGVDVAPRAVELARVRTTGAVAARCRFEVNDFLSEPPAGSFSFVFDRGCFHVFDESAERARFAANVGRVLAPGGLWLSLIGSTEGPPREFGPPRRSAQDIVAAVEPVLAIHELAAVQFDGLPATAWRCVALRRAVPAQLSTRHSA